MRSPQRLPKQNPALRGSVCWGPQHEHQGPHLEGREGELQAGVLEGQEASGVAPLQEVAAGGQEGL